MGTFQVNLEGEPVTGTRRQVEIGKLRLDEDNPRIGLYRDSQPKETLRDADILHAIRNRSPHAYSKLRDSIEINQGVINEIWVGPEENGVHLVIEGNTRVLIYRELAEKYPTKDEWKAIPAKVLPRGIQNSQINFIRLEAHLRGVTEWDAYERARYLYILNEREGYSVRRLEQLIRLDARDIEVEIRAFRDMANIYRKKFPDDQYEAQKFSYFVEYERSKRIQRGMRVQGKTIEDFCDWVGVGRIPKAENVRQLPDILEDDTATERFVEEGYDRAVGYLALAKPDRVSPLFQRIEELIERLRRMSWYDIDDIRSGEHLARRRLIGDLARTAASVWKRVSDDDDDMEEGDEEEDSL